jgi:hypothetical protein
MKRLRKQRDRKAAPPQVKAPSPLRSSLRCASPRQAAGALHRSAQGPAPLYRLKIVLTGTRPPIWRRLQVPDNANLGWLHAVIQVAMGWTNSHMHHFLTPEARYSSLHADAEMDLGAEPDRDEGEATLAEIAPRQRTQFAYEYDFGDSWWHLVTVEKILPPDPAFAGRALCVGGARACPPEDCGGVSGYADLLETIQDPEHEEHESMMEWLGGPLDPEAFDRDKVNRYLGKLKWPHVTVDQLRRVLMARDGYRE